MKRFSSCCTFIEPNAPTRWSRRSAALLAEPLADPFAPEVVAVPTRGMERWLTQRMSASLGASAGRSDGVCANVEFPFPRRLVGDAVAAASGIDPEEDPWLPERAVWPLLEVVDECLGEPWLHSLAAHLGKEGDADRRARRFATVRHLAELFDRYALHRPEMVRGWARGEVDVAAEAAWQAELWRRLRERIARAEPRRAARTRVRAPARGPVAARPARAPLAVRPDAPARPATSTCCARSPPAATCTSSSCIPSPALWETLRRATAPVVRRADDTTAAIPGNRLLASWGQDAREMQLVLGTRRARRPSPPGRPRRRHAARAHPGRRARRPLAARRPAARCRRRPPAARPGRPQRPGPRLPRPRAPGRGPARRDPAPARGGPDTLEPRDVIVMCPDIETFAPLIQATFGAGEVVEDDELEPLPAERAPDRPARAPRRPLAAPDQPGARRRRASCSTSRRAG